ncbi:unnamed protein product [Rotaria sp. Silwood2]|nr:unnamed protein product [Rotaria sp. Silwood2]CAF4213708.1 unnamed protein product [Rotaria sp. Silwood2]
MPWKVLSFQDRKRSEALYKHFKVYRNSNLIVLSSSGEVITSNDSREFAIKSDLVLCLWSQRKSLFYSCQSQPGEFQWNRIDCSQCYMRPLASIRYGCINC